MPTATMTSKGQITVPRVVRRQLGLQTGTRVTFVEDGAGGYRLVPDAGSLSAAAGMIKASRHVTLDEMERAIAEGALESIAS